MTDDKKKMNLTPIEDLITEDFGAVGTPERDQFEMECDAFIIGEQLKDERADAFLIARNMLRAEGDLFLDDLSLTDAQAALPAPLRVVDNTGEALWQAIAGLEGW